MEQLLHYCWKHKLYPLQGLHTTDGEPVEVIDPGLHNFNAGPDFFNAKVKIGGTLWVGNVEIHDKSSDWFLHGHERDPHYNNTVLHVAGRVDCVVTTANGLQPPQVELAVPDTVRHNYEELLRTDTYPPCYKVIPQAPRLKVRSWMSALETERLERKTEDIRRRARLCDGSWEGAYFVTIARNYGFGINGDAMEQWALSVPLNDVGHHRDNAFQVEAFFMGQAGLLDTASMPERHRQAAIDDDYFQRLQHEYAYLAHKFQLTPIDYRLWRFLRLRPQNFPHIRIAQLVNLYCQRKTSLSLLVETGQAMISRTCSPHRSHLTGRHTTPSAARVPRARSISRPRPSICCLSTRWCRCSLPTAAISRTTNSATGPSTSSNEFAC